VEARPTHACDLSRAGRRAIEPATFRMRGQDGSRAECSMADLQICKEHFLVWLRFETDKRA